MQVSYGAECGDTVTGNLTLTSALDCISNSTDGLIVGADNITIDCDGYSIIGPGTDNGISASGYDRITIKNCNISEYNDGVNLDDSDDSFLLNNIISFNFNEGVLASNSLNLNIS